MGEPGPIAKSIEGEVAKIKAETPASFTVGAYTDGHNHRGQVTYDRKWSNGWGLTAYARAWWNDVAVTPVPGPPANHYGAEIGIEGKYEFKPPQS